jgi:hypothetical protein
MGFFNFFSRKLEFHVDSLKYWIYVICPTKLYLFFNFFPLIIGFLSLALNCHEFKKKSYRKIKKKTSIPIFQFIFISLLEEGVKCVDNLPTKREFCI